jgi:purine-binding chemotaxis protein CheW
VNPDVSLASDIDAWLAADEPAAAAAPPPVAAPAPAPLPLGAPTSLLDAVAAIERAAGDSVAAAAPAPADPRPPAAAQEIPRYVLFSVAGAYYAAPQSFVSELDRVPAITFVPNVPPWLRGITNRRGDILSVVDLRTLLGLERLPTGAGRLLVVRLRDDSCTLGLLVDEVQQIVGLSPDDVRVPDAGLEGPLVPFLSGIAALDQRTVALLDLDALLRSPLLRQFDEPAETPPATT